MKAVVNSQDIKEQKVKNVFRTVMLQKSKADYKVDDGSGKVSDLEYAQTYAHAGLVMKGEALRVQVMYVLCNTQYWRGDEARRCKKVLKEFVGGKR